MCETPLSKQIITTEFSVSLPSVRRDRRRMFRRLNHCAVPGYAPLCMDSNDPETVNCAFTKRLLRTLPKPKQAVLSKFSIFVRNWLSANVSKVVVMTFDDWLASTSYNDARKMELRAVHDSLRGGLPSKKQAAHIDSFIKSESYPEWKNARIINSRSDAFKVFCGPYIKSVENEVYRLPYFAKHTTIDQRKEMVKNLCISGNKYYATDFTAFESHFTPEFMNMCECQLYLHCLSNYADAEFLCRSLTGKNSMRTRHGVRAEVPGRRMSGDVCTSLGNGFTNLMLALFIVEQKHGTLTGLVEGDDGLFSSTVPITAQDYLDLGFTIKIEEVDDPTKASFCGLIFGESGQVIRNPYRFIQNFGWTGSFISAGPRIMDGLLKAKAMSALTETPHCPIVSVLAQHALDLTIISKALFVEDGYHIHNSSFSSIPFNPSPETREYFAKVFAIPISTQLLVEKAIHDDDMDLVAQYLPAPVAIQEYCSNYVVPT